jgi:ABC-type transport system involved in multi-copper enzyme maturation permease subunit
VISLVVARNTFREATRDRVLTGLVAAGVVLLGGTQILGHLALGEGRRITLDLGLSGISILGLFAVMLVGTSLVAKEIERRTIYNLLSRPIPRHAYLIGKWVGLTAALWVLCASLGLALYGLVALRGWVVPGVSLVQAVYLAGLEMAVITSIAVLFSTLSTPVLSSLYTLGCFAVGQWSYDLRIMADQLPAPVRGGIEVLASVVPNLPIFNVRHLVAAGAPVAADHMVLASIYAVVYCGCALALAAAAFESRDFK